MYVPTAFREERVDVLWAFMRSNGFATVVTCGSGGMIASHVPVVLDETRGDLGLLRTHVARGNTQWREMGEEVLVVFHGAHAYVSPTWYVSAMAVPTWNYMVVHAYGRPRIVQEVEGVKEILAATVRQYEGDQGWSMDAAPAEWVDGHAHGVVAFEIEVTRLEGKFKLGQNRSAADRKSTRLNSSHSQ